MQKTIVYILGTSFSGSSLLNSVFDSQPRTRGLGEAVHLVHKPTNAWCGHCECHVDDCQLQAKIDPDRFYASLFEAYPETDVIVNSSKNWKQCFRLMELPPEQYRLRMVVLSKSLEEFAYSYSTHESCENEESFAMWFDYHEHLFCSLDGLLQNSPRTDVQRQLVSRISSADVAYVRYHELATQTDATIKRLCDQLALPFDRAFRDRLWGGDTCTIGGNNAIYAQRTHHAVFFEPQQDYLSGKYSGRQGTVFYDDFWKGDRDLGDAAQKYRASKAGEIELMESRLGCLQPRHDGPLIG